MPRSGVYRLAQANGDSEFSQIKKELDTMKDGEMRHVRTGSGRENLITVKKGTPKASEMGQTPARSKSKIVPRVMSIRG